MFSKECIRCEKMFECAGKKKDKPCLHFKERNGVKKNDKTGGNTGHRRSTSKS